MKKTLMPMLGFLALLLAAMFLASYAGFSFKDSTNNNAGGSGFAPTPTPTFRDDENTPIALLPQLVVLQFTNRFLEAASPQANSLSAPKAYSFLSTAVQSHCQEQNLAVPACLTNFSQVQDLPDQGYEIGEAVQKGNSVEISSLWHYSTGPVEKLFTLIKEQGAWKISSID